MSLDATHNNLLSSARHCSYEVVNFIEKTQVKQDGDTEVEIVAAL